MIWVLSLGYVVVGALAVLAAIGLRAPLLVKLLAITLVSVSYAGTYLGYRALQGWPSEQDLPERFRLQWVLVEEPQGDVEGALFFWVRELDANGFVVSEPRAHRLPWDRALAEEAQDAVKRIEEGETLNGYFSRQLLDVADSDLPESDRSDSGSRQRPGGDGAVRIEFREVARPSLPAKPAVER